jgi:hypothetical protein
MATNYDDTQLRRYLLGELADKLAETLEWDYFAREDLFDRMRAAESDLVDDYVAGRLSRPERDRFERHYLATPVHRQRLVVASELRAASQAAAPVPEPNESYAWWTAVIDSLRGSRQPLTAALAVALLLLVGAGLWMLRFRPAPTDIVVTSPEATTPSREASPPSGTVGSQRPESQVTPEPSPRIGPVTIALALSPLSVRGADEGPILIIPTHTQLVVLQLEGDADGPPVVGGRAVVRTVSGRTIWRGPATTVRDAPALFSRVEIPAETLASDDYIVTLSETDRDGRDAERYRYFLRVRPR